MYLEWTQEYKDEIGKRYLINANIPKMENLSELNVQELSFLINSAHYFQEKKAFPNNNLEEKLRVFNKCILEKIKNSDELYIVYNKSTNYPFILPNDEFVLIYSDEVYAYEAVEHYKKEKLNLEYKEYKGEDVIKIFVDLYRIGIENIIIDMSDKTYKYTFKRSEILPPADWSNTPKISIPIYNPEIVKLMILYYQALDLNKVDNYNAYIRNIADLMSVKMLRAKFLIPMKIDGELEDVPDKKNEKVVKSNTHINFPILEDNDNTLWTPVFTDWEEFKKTYNSEEWGGQIVSLEDALCISNNTGIVINSHGTPIRIDEENKKSLKNSLKRLKEIDELINDKRVHLISDNFYIGEIREEDNSFAVNAKKACKKIRSIKKSYVKLKIQNDIMSYLLLIDFKGDKKDVFPSIAKELTPFLNNMYLDIHELDGWAEEIVKDSKPLYKKFFV